MSNIEREQGLLWIHLEHIILNYCFEFLKCFRASCVYEVWESSKEIIDIWGKIVPKLVRQIRSIAPRLPWERPNPLEGWPWEKKQSDARGAMHWFRNHVRKTKLQGRKVDCKWVQNVIQNHKMGGSVDYIFQWYSTYKVFKSFSTVLGLICVRFSYFIGMSSGIFLKLPDLAKYPPRLHGSMGFEVFALRLPSRRIRESFPGWYKEGHATLRGGFRGGPPL